LQLVIEVSNSTLDFDLKNKAGLYGRAAIADYWVLDVIGRQLVVHRDPRNGMYRSVMAFGEHESVAPLARPDASFRVREAFARI
jgi:Uma2 family endonuclease